MTFKYVPNVSLECECAQELGMCTSKDCSRSCGETKQEEKALTWDGAPPEVLVRGFHWLMNSKTGTPIEALWLPELKMWLIKGAEAAVQQITIARAYSHMTTISNSCKIEELAMSIFKGALRP